MLEGVSAAYTEQRSNARSFCDEAEADCELWSRTRVTGPLHHRFQTAVEDARDPVGLGEQGRVAQRQGQAKPGSPQGAG